VAVAVWLLLRVALPLCTRRGRTVAGARWRRLLAWEFWPLALFYAPVVAGILVLAARYRSLTLVTAVNPGMPEGGFVGESKHEILRRLAGAGDRIARTRLISAALPPQERIRVASDFLRTEDLRFPVVVKPDAGQRGEGVRIVRSGSELHDVLGSARRDQLVQEYVDGPEFGIFYARRPRDEAGRIISITEKILPEVVGDGRSTLAQLILRDARAAMSAETYFAANASRLGHVPSAGEAVRLVDLGTHCRGAVFRDGGHLLTPALEQAVEEVSRTYEGFYFGRYDVRAPSVEALRAGRFRVLELNGMTSEATHVYDPRHSLPAAWRTLIRQWALAFEIAAANRAAGAEPASLRKLIRRLADHGLRPAHP
jgi:hypothetical protein